MTHLTVLSLSGTSIGNVGMSCLAAAVKQDALCQCVELALDNCDVRDSGVISLMRAVLSTTGPLAKLQILKMDSPEGHGIFEFSFAWIVKRFFGSACSVSSVS